MSNSYGPPVRPAGPLRRLSTSEGQLKPNPAATVAGKLQLEVLHDRRGRLIREIRGLRPPRASGLHRLARRAPRRPGPRRRRVGRGRAALRDRPHPRRGQDRLAHRPQRPGRPATTSTAPASRSSSARRASRRDTTVVIYGDKSNWWAAYALWVFTLFGHEDVRLLDGGRASGRPRAASIRRMPRPSPPWTTRSSSATTRRSAPSRTTCSPTSATR